MPTTSLTPAGLNERMSRAVARAMHWHVVLEDVCGEGEGAWHSDPRFPDDRVNCLVWFQLLISNAYAQRPEDLPRILDRMRYYEGAVAYGLRKHFLDHWLGVEPGPVKKLQLRGLEGYRSKTVELDFDHFKARHQYRCDLYREDAKRFEVESLTASGVVKYLESLPPGYYLCFPVANELYLRVYGQNSGPMGFVHPSVIQWREPGPASPEGGGAEVGEFIYHASTAAHVVIKYPLQQYLDEKVKIYEGYGIFALDPGWDFSKPRTTSAEARRILNCEAKLPKDDCRRLI